jgi:hypothetical protein
MTFFKCFRDGKRRRSIGFLYANGGIPAPYESSETEQTMPLTLDLKIDSIGADSGWMKCWLVVDEELHQILATSVFPPFGDVLRFLRAIASDNLPHEFFWEEEGHGIKFRASQSVRGSDHVHISINHDGEIVVDADLERKPIIQAFFEALRDFALDCPGAESEWDFPYFLIENFEHDLAHGFAPHADSVSVPNFVFGHYGGYGGQSLPSFVLWIDNRRAFYFFPDDIPRLWWLWFELLHKIARGELPFEVSFDQAEEEKDKESIFSLLSFIDTHSLLFADWLPNTAHFQLKITGQNSLVPEPYLLVDATLERRAFILAFMEAFEKFPGTNYLVYLESGENNFDLREIPWDDLK